MNFSMIVKNNNFLCNKIYNMKKLSKVHGFKKKSKFAKL